MRIIDKNTDFYDYLQNVYPDKSITFDRTDSFVLTKEILCSYLERISDDDAKYQFLLIQVCNTFWLFLITVTKTVPDLNRLAYVALSTPVNYEIELLSTWKNYNKKRVLISMSLIRFNFEILYHFRSRRRDRYSRDSFIKESSILSQAVDNNEFTVRKHINNHIVYNGDGSRSKKTMPLFKACGVAEYINPLDLYLSFEEYFSLERQANERTESIGLTDKEKVENHGFSTKTSFRGKCKKE